jgi:hypothetical protein
MTFIGKAVIFIDRAIIFINKAMAFIGGAATFIGRAIIFINKRSLVIEKRLFKIAKARVADNIKINKYNLRWWLMIYKLKGPLVLINSLISISNYSVWLFL